jgi:hypothetical protein
VIRRPLLPALAVVVALAVAGCGGGSDSSEPADSGSGTSSSGTSGTTGSPGTAQTGTVEGVRLTPPGTRLKVGETARVSWQPDQKTTAVVALTVTGLLKVPISTFSAWRLPTDTKRSTPYFVQVSVRNLGRSDLSGVHVPLYLLDKRGSLLEASTFEATFTPCPSRPLPAKFRKGAEADACLVYFAPDHGELVAVSFRPSEDFAQILWEGAVVTSSGQRQKQD